MFINFENEPSKNNILEFEKQCISNEGIFLKEYNECENGIDEKICKKLKGEYNSCASSCRNNKNKDLMCTKECVMVCKLK